jgi:hypothetical protein
MVGKHRGRFALRAERELIALAEHGATASELALRFGTKVKTIEQKARALGISIKKRPVAIGRKAEKRGRAWTPEEDAILRRGALAGRTAGAIAEQLGRTGGAVRTRAYSLRIILGRPPLTTGEIALCHRALAAWERYFGAE